MDDLDFEKQQAINTTDIRWIKNSMKEQTRLLYGILLTAFGAIITNILTVV